MLTEDRRVSFGESLAPSLDDFIQKLTGEDILKPLRLKKSKPRRRSIE